MPNHSHLHSNTHLLETMRLNKRGQIALLPLHLQRLQHSAHTLGFQVSLQAVLQALAPYLHQSHAQPQRLRLLVDRLGHITLSCEPLAPTLSPVRLVLAKHPIQANSYALRHKTTQRQHWAVGEHWLQKHPTFFDVIYSDEKGFITEGGRSNIYVFKNNQWLTPAISTPLLAGVQRQFLLNQGWVSEASLRRQDLLEASRLRISNALRGWLDATLVLNTN